MGSAELVIDIISLIIRYGITIACLIGCYIIATKNNKSAAFTLLGLFGVIGLAAMIIIVKLGNDDKYSNNYNNNNYNSNINDNNTNNNYSNTGNDASGKNYNDGGYSSQNNFMNEYSEKSTEEDRFKFCTKCGAKIERKATFCTYCGKQF